MVTVCFQQVVIHKEVHGVGKGGYDCGAGADNWMQGWQLGSTVHLAELDNPYQ